MKDFLVELLTEELPPKSLLNLAESLQKEIGAQLADFGFEKFQTKIFATPRRLAVHISNLAETQKDHLLEKFGPNVNFAYDKAGNPTKAATGFAKSCYAEIKDLQVKNDRLYFSKIEKGRSVFELMPEIVTHAIKQLPIPKPMRWGSNDTEFVRPVHNVLMMYGSKIIPAEILGLKTNNKTNGHRFLSKGVFIIKTPREYEEKLLHHFVIADFEKRKTTINKQIEKISSQNKCIAIINDDLLNEVTSLVEFPEVLLANFPKKFLDVPKEALISSIQSHQKCFATVDKKNNLLPHFITVSNIKSKDKKEVILGNERVMNARLADAEFFYHTDLKTTLESRTEQLKNVIFQKQLGTLYDKSARVSKLAELIANALKIDENESARAGLLAKTDLMTTMVGEFPELQGIMGRYYAVNDKEPKAVAIALDEQYMPRHSGDALPKNPVGKVLALADRLDTLVGIFGINKQPSGTKDPFALRRQALGLIRIILENDFTLDLQYFLQCAQDLFFGKLTNKNVNAESLLFIKERLKYWALEQNFTANEYAAVNANEINDLGDFYQRLIAVRKFSKLKEAESLAAANKRVNNILAKQEQNFCCEEIDSNYLHEKEEKALAKLIAEKNKTTKLLYSQKKYTEILKELSSLKAPIDNFFDHVMVMVENEHVKKNRLVLLAKLRELFLQVADISFL